MKFVSYPSQSTDQIYLVVLIVCAKIDFLRSLSSPYPTTFLPLLPATLSTTLPPIAVTLSSPSPSPLSLSSPPPSPPPSVLPLFTATLPHLNSPSPSSFHHPYRHPHLNAILSTLPHLTATLTSTLPPPPSQPPISSPPPSPPYLSHRLHLPPSPHRHPHNLASILSSSLPSYLRPTIRLSPPFRNPSLLLHPRIHPLSLSKKLDPPPLAPSLSLLSLLFSWILVSCSGMLADILVWLHASWADIF